MAKILTLLQLLSALAYAQHSHIWIKTAEFTDDNRKTICLWECASHDGAATTTGGYGYCPYPLIRT